MSKNQNIRLPKILIVDDDPAIRRALGETLVLSCYEVIEACEGQECLDMVAKYPDIDTIILDISMKNGMDGDKALIKLTELYPEIPVIIFSAHSDIESVVKMMQYGAFNFLPKPPDLSKLLPTIKKAMDRKKELLQEGLRSVSSYRNRGGHRKTQKSATTSSTIIGESEVILTMKKQLKAVATVDEDVLLLGENGTGKTIAAKWIHDNSARSNAPFITINANAISETMVEAELFGSKKGSFGSSVKDIRGFFEMAEGGTLFIDEIGNLPAIYQSKLLNVINDREYKIIGDDKITRMNIRIITATNKNLEAESKAGNYMIDFYYRLARVTIEVPPLRDRGNDIITLLYHYNEKNAAKMGKSPLVFSELAIKAIKAHSWIGNVRSLESFVVTLLIFHGDERLEDRDVMKKLP